MRWLPFEQCGNFRDIGGYRVAGGGITRWRRVYRSGALGNMTPTDVECFTRELDVRTVVDLRTDDEVARTGQTAWLSKGGPSTLRLPQDNPAATELAAGAYDASALYVWNLEQKSSDFASLLRLLSDERHLPCVIQCSGGKDRTGIMVALLLELLGVSSGDIVGDYALSDEACQRYPDEYAASKARVIAAGLDPEVLHARPDTMKSFLEAFHRAWGSADAFARRGGADDALIEAVRERLLVDD